MPLIIFLIFVPLICAREEADLGFFFDFIFLILELKHIDPCEKGINYFRTYLEFEVKRSSHKIFDIVRRHKTYIYCFQ